jgi:squalene-hopene/tetraprenyl-beta-curcumene cyclase
MRRLLCVAAASLLACSLCLAQVNAGAGTRPSRRDVSMLMESRAAVARALDYLAGRQEDDGSWMHDPAITGLVVTAMVGSDLDGYGADGPPVARALGFVRGQARPDGGIYARFYPNYTTSICAMALVEAGTPPTDPILRRARAYLLGMQADEAEGVGADDPQYGGWGYEPNADGEGMHRADMSNTQFALEAIHALEAIAEEDAAAAGTGEGAQTRVELAYDKAIRYLSRCQNLKATNDQPWAANDGGFVYRPGESKAGEAESEDEGEETNGLRSYGGMTYAGLKSMVYARLKRDDPRVVAAWGWISRNWSVTENPGIGQQGLYYYYLTMARALNATGAEQIVEAGGKAHDWRVELTQQLLKVQRADGSWFNENGRWMEQIPDLVTAYSVIALEHAMRGW